MKLSCMTGSGVTATRCTLARAGRGGLAGAAAGASPGAVLSIAGTSTFDGPLSQPLSVMVTRPSALTHLTISPPAKAGAAKALASSNVSRGRVANGMAGSERSNATYLVLE